MGKTYGEKTHTQTVAEMAPHNHGGGTGGSPHQHGIASEYGTTINLNVGVPGPYNQLSIVGWGGSADYRYNYTRADGDHSHSIGSQGGGGAFNVIQPTRAALLVIKT